MKKIIYLLCVLGLFTSANAQWPFGKDVEWYINGPKKECSKRDHDRYYRWRDRLYRSRMAGTQDEQILQRQKAILNGKATPDIEDVNTIIKSVLRHRIIINFNAEADGMKVDDILDVLMSK